MGLSSFWRAVISVVQAPMKHYSFYHAGSAVFPVLRRRTGLLEAVKQKTGQIYFGDI